MGIFGWRIIFCRKMMFVLNSQFWAILGWIWMNMWVFSGLTHWLMRVPDYTAQKMTHNIFSKFPIAFSSTFVFGLLHHPSHINNHSTRSDNSQFSQLSALHLQPSPVHLQRSELFRRQHLLELFGFRPFLRHLFFHFLPFLLRLLRHRFFNVNFAILRAMSV